MLERIMAWDGAVWEGHSRTFEDITHVFEGMGFGLVLSSILGDRARSTGYILIVVTALIHVYAIATARRPIVQPEGAPRMA
jgi:hypothetical protein